jgi:Zn finger protein HypA/HybF involved in hydrogenase expression
MTSETRTLIDLSDITGIEIECRDCTAKVFYPRKNNHERIARQCPNCNADLFVTRNGQSEAMNNVKALIRILELVGAPAAEANANVRLHLATRPT